jgi:hypothetical protein
VKDRKSYASGSREIVSPVPRTLAVVNLGAASELKKTLGKIVSDRPVGVEWHTNAETRRLTGMMSEMNRQKLPKRRRPANEWLARCRSARALKMERRFRGQKSASWLAAPALGRMAALGRASLW